MTDDSNQKFLFTVYNCRVLISCTIAVSYNKTFHILSISLLPTSDPILVHLLIEKQCKNSSYTARCTNAYVSYRINIFTSFIFISLLTIQTMSNVSNTVYIGISIFHCNASGWLNLLRLKWVLLFKCDIHISLCGNTQ